MKVTWTRYSGGTSWAVFLPNLPVPWHSVVSILGPILNFPFSYPNVYLYLETRMHSSRMRTAHSSSHRGSLDLIPPQFPLGCGPGSDPPSILPLYHQMSLVWAWTWSLSISPLGVGLDLIPLNFPLGVGLEHTHTHTPLGPDPLEQAPPQEQAPQDQTPPVNRMTNRCKNITLPQTSFAGGN